MRSMLTFAQLSLFGVSFSSSEKWCCLSLLLVHLQVKFVIEAHGGGFRRELLEDIMMTMLEFSDTVY